MNKSERQEIIGRLLADKDVRSQAELAELLAAMGLEVSQATLSRDLREMGVFRDALGRYRLPKGALDQLRFNQIKEIMRLMVKSVAYSGNIVVVKTNPGQAHPVASAIDGLAFDGVIGTVAGDDTVLTVIQEGVKPQEVCIRIKKFAGL